MDISSLDGFLTALAIRPNPAMPDRWLPWVFDMEDGETGVDDLIRVAYLVTRHFKYIAQWLREDPGSFEPIYERGPEWGGVRKWCEGFLIGTAIDGDVWAPLAASQPTWLTPFVRLGTNIGREMTLKEGGRRRAMDERGGAGRYQNQRVLDGASCGATRTAAWNSSGRARYAEARPQRSVPVRQREEI